MAHVIGDVIFEIPEIYSTYQGIDDPASGLSLSVYPNPLGNQSRIEFSLVKECRIIVEVYDIMGIRLNTITEATYPAGRHQLILDGRTLTPGMYLLKITITDNNQSFSKTVKVIVSK
jgi:hypothetical protein